MRLGLVRVSSRQRFFNQPARRFYNALFIIANDIHSHYFKIMFSSFLPFVDLIADDPSRPYEEFRSATEAGNEAYCQGALDCAHNHFDDALSVARRLFLRAANGETCPKRAATALILARQNAAQTLLRLGQVDEAGRQLRASHQMLFIWRESENASIAMQEAIDTLYPHVTEISEGFFTRYGRAALPGEIQGAPAEIVQYGTFGR